MLALASIHIPLSYALTLHILCAPMPAQNVKLAMPARSLFCASVCPVSSVHISLNARLTDLLADCDDELPSITIHISPTKSHYFHSISFWVRVRVCALAAIKWPECTWKSERRTTHLKQKGPEKIKKIGIHGGLVWNVWRNSHAETESKTTTKKGQTNIARMCWATTREKNERA